MVITEIGGTVGDIEGLPFLEAIRQFALDVGKQNCLYIHLTLVPYLKAAGEAKTKPTQHSVGQLRQIGIQPDILICRTERELAKRRWPRRSPCSATSSRGPSSRSATRTFSIYEVPLSLVENELDELIVEKLDLHGQAAGHRRLARPCSSACCNPDHEVTIAVVGKYIKHHDAYKSVYESLDHAGIALTDAGCVVRKVEAEDDRARGGRAHARRRRRRAGAGRLRLPRHRRQDRGHPLRPRAAACRSSASAWACSAP